MIQQFRISQPEHPQSFSFQLLYWPILKDLANILFPSPVVAQDFSCWFKSGARCDG